MYKLFTSVPLYIAIFFHQVWHCSSKKVRKMVKEIRGKEIAEEWEWDRYNYVDNEDNEYGNHGNGG